MSNAQSTTAAKGRPVHPFCRKCNWRMGGVDSWDGVRCKCGHHAAPFAYQHPERATVTMIDSRANEVRP